MRWQGDCEQYDERHASKTGAHHDADGELPLTRECDLLVMHFRAQQFEARLGDAQQLVEQRFAATDDRVRRVSHSSVSAPSSAPKELAKTEPRISPSAVAPPTT